MISLLLLTLMSREGCSGHQFCEKASFEMRPVSIYGRALTGSPETLLCCWWQDAFPLHVVPENRFQRTATLLLYLNDVSEVQCPLFKAILLIFCLH